MKWEQLIFRIYDYNLKKMLYSDPKMDDFFYDTEFDKPICYRKIEKSKVFKEHKISEPMVWSLRKDYNDKYIFEGDIIFCDTSNPYDEVFYKVVFKKEEWIFKALIEPKINSRTFKERSVKNDPIEKIIYGYEYRFFDKIIIEGNIYQDIEKFVPKKNI